MNTHIPLYLPSRPSKTGIAFEVYRRKSTLLPTVLKVAGWAVAFAMAVGALAAAN